jgi:glycosyltransferase involved in cell wall biosynthesis
MSLVSIIIPCYNYGWVLSETLESVLAQTHTQWECIVIDDGSTDSTRAIVERFIQRDARFTYIHQDQLGISSARNKGLSVAKGEYIQFLDADDMLAKRKLELQVEFLAMHSQIDIIYSDVRFFVSERPEELKKNYNMYDTEWMPRVSGKGDFILGYLIEGNIVVMNAPLIRSGMIKNSVYFMPELTVMEDWYFWICCAIQGANFYYDGRQESWALVRVHSTSVSKNRMRMYLYENYIRRTLIDGKVKKEINDINNHKIVALSEILAVEFADKKEVKNTIKNFFYAAKYSKRYFYYLKSGFFWTKKCF